MASDYLGLRLNDKKHKDIIKWLSKFEDKSEEARRLLRLGIQISNGQHAPKEKERLQPLTWNFPTEPTAPPVAPKPRQKDLVNNILNSFDV